MLSLTRKALAVAAGLALISTAAMAGLPDPSESSVESPLLGQSSGTLVPLQKGSQFGVSAGGLGYTVIVKDQFGAAVPGALVTLDYAGTGVVPYDQPDNDPGAAVDCLLYTMSKVADGTGTAIFATPAFHGTTWLELSGKIKVIANGVTLSLVDCTSMDMIGTEGEVDGADLGKFALDKLAEGGLGCTTCPETDWNLNGITGGGDLGIFANEKLYFATNPPKSVCP
jgi:hypothetical protein